MQQDWLLYRAQKSPQKSFIKKGDSSYSFKEVNDIVYDRACSLVNYGVNKKDTVAILLSDPLDFIEAYLACYKLGVSSMILNDQWREGEVRKVMKDKSVNYIICNWKDKGLFKNLNRPIIFFEELSKSHGNCFNAKINFTSLKEDIQSILFTSGTKGVPKGVCLTYDNFYNSSLKWAEAIGLNNDDTYMLNLPLYHISGLAIIMRSIHLGLSTKIKTDLKNDNYKSTIISLVPTMIDSLINEEHSIQELQSLRCIVLSGSSISDDLLSQCKSLKLNIFLSYGMTETCSSICGFWPFEESEKKGSVGRPFKGVSLSVKDKRLYIESDTIMKSYINSTDSLGAIHTNDLGKLKDGYVYVYGRDDNLIISGGENIDPSEAINALKNMYNFDKIESFKKKNSHWGEVSGLYIYTDRSINLDEIIEKLKQILSPHKIPKQIVIKSSKTI